MVKLVTRTLSKLNAKWTAVCLALATSTGLIAFAPSMAMATETETEKKLKEVTTQVGSEGVSIVLAILAGLVALIAAVIIIPKGLSMIKRCL